VSQEVEREPALPRSGGSLEWVNDVPLQLTVEIGSARLLLRDVLQLDAGSVIALDRDSGSLADVLINGRVVARGDITAADDRIAIRIVEVVASEKR
jgi:flagellar motor switch protein FliN/FliY